MGKIVYLMGKSASGKDTVYKELLKGRGTGGHVLRRIVPYTTRPPREGEHSGREYFFTDEEEYRRLENRGRIIEHREYNTCHGLWRYFTVDDGQIDLETGSYLMIGTPEGYRGMKAYFGADSLLPVLIQVDDGIRLQRALDRERAQQNPKYAEMCRRFLADEVDFNRNKICAEGITQVFCNDQLEECLSQINEYIRSGCAPKAE